MSCGVPQGCIHSDHGEAATLRRAAGAVPGSSDRRLTPRSQFDSTLGGAEG